MKQKIARAVLLVGIIGLVAVFYHAGLMNVFFSVVGVTVALRVIVLILQVLVKHKK